MPRASAHANSGTGLARRGKHRRARRMAGDHYSRNLGTASVIPQRCGSPRYLPWYFS